MHGFELESKYGENLNCKYSNLYSKIRDIIKNRLLSRIVFQLLYRIYKCSQQSAYENIHKTPIK